MDDFNTIFLVMVLGLWAIDNIDSCLEDLKKSSGFWSAAWNISVIPATVYMFCKLTAWLWKFHPITF